MSVDWDWVVIEIVIVIGIRFVSVVAVGIVVWMVIGMVISGW